MTIITEEGNLVDPTHTVAINSNLWENHPWSEGEWSPSKQWEIALISFFTDKYVNPGGTTLEIGVGSGRWCGYLQKVSKEFIGIDLTDRAIQMCKTKYSNVPNMSFYQNNGTDLSCISDQVIDFIWSFDVFVHISPHDVRSYIKELNRVMKVGAIAVIHHGRSANPEGWRSTLTTEMFNAFLAENNLTLLEQRKTWGKNYQYHVTHKDDISIFTKKGSI
jgi:ubiquinone/menaquinone biosynthesis C-methylase UbiE